MTTRAVRFSTDSSTSSITYGTNYTVIVDDAQLERAEKSAKPKEPDIEPEQYFKLLKGKLKKAEFEKIQKRLDAIGDQILKAKAIGQTAFLEQLSFTYDVLVKEQILFTKGYKKFVYKDDVKEFIDKVTPKNSIRIIELDRFPRAIPMDVMEKLADVKAANIFDDYLVVFTDLTGMKSEDYQSPKEKEFIKRNRDPIVFGFFRHEKTGLNHDRWYFIADWEDQYCDLTFDKMIDKMAKQGIKTPAREIATDHEYIHELARSVVENLGKKDEEKEPLPEPHAAEAPKSWWGRLWDNLAA